MVNDILRVAKIFKALEINSSRGTKESILKVKENSEDEIFIAFLKMIYNPYITTKISTKKLMKESSGIVGYNIDSVEGFLKFLSEDSTGKIVDVMTVKNFIAKVMEQGKDFLSEKDIALINWLLEGTVCKNLKVGITSTTINKVYGKNFIPSFKIMLAEKWVDYDKKKEIEIKNYEDMQGKEVVATLKIDGNRAEIIRKGNKVTIFSREGREIEGCYDIEQAFLNTLVSDGVYEGELLAMGEFENANERFKKTSSILRSKGLKTGLEFVMFDFIALENFENAEEYGYSCVLRKLHARQTAKFIDSKYVRYLHPMYEGIFDFKKLEAIASEMKAQGEEGIMVQSAFAPYEFKRVKHLLKVKSFESADIKCVDVYVGKTGKNIGRLGGIVCEYKGSKVYVGGGFDEHLRDDYWNNPSLIVGKIVEVKFFEEFISDDGSYDLRFAVFKSIREDKTEESYY